MEYTFYFSLVFKLVLLWTDPQLSLDSGGLIGLNSSYETSGLESQHQKEISGDNDTEFFLYLFFFLNIQNKLQFLKGILSYKSISRLLLVYLQYIKRP